MGKDKKRNFDDQEKSETLFYYELIGVITIILSITILGKLGKVGSLFTIFFKVIFGDWYWFFLLFILFLGFYSLFKHQKFPIKNQRFIGVLFISLGILIFAHFPLHNYVVSLEGSYFNNTWGVYNNYINNSLSTYLGGGILGAFIFFAIYYLLGSIGVTLFASLIIMFGFSLVINKSIVDMIKFVFYRFKNVKKHTKSFNNFFKYEIGKTKEVSKKSVFLKSQTLSIKSLDDIDNSMILCLQEKINEENKSLIQSILNNLHIEYKCLDVIKSYSVTTYKFLIFSEFDEEAIIGRLNNVLDENALFSRENNTLSLQINNKHHQILSVKSLLLEQVNLYQNYNIPLGKAYDNSIITLDFANKNELLVVGESHEEINNYLYHLIISLFAKVDLINYTIELFCDNSQLNEVYDLIENNNHHDLINYLDILIKDIDNRNEIIDKSASLSIDEYNNKISLTNEKNPVMKKKFIIINDPLIDLEHFAYFENKIMYIIQIGKKCGYSLVLTTTNKNLLSSVILSVFFRKIIFKCLDYNFSEIILGNQNALYLDERQDAFFVFQNKSIRFQAPFASKNDLNSLNKNIK